jgi:hypothetical protein
MAQFSLLIWNFTDIMQQSCSFRQLGVHPEFRCHDPTEVCHFATMHQEILSIGRSETHFADHPYQLFMKTMDPEFDDGAFSYFHDLLFDLPAGFLHNLFDTGRVDPSVCHQALQRKTCDLTAQRIEGRKHDGLRGVVHHQIDTCGGFDGPDIPSLATDDLTFDLVSLQIKDGDRVLNGLFCSCALDGLNDDLAGFLVGALLCIFDDLLLQGEGLGLHLLFEAFQQLGFSLLCGETCDLFEPADVLFLVLLQFRAFLIDDFDLAVQLFLDAVVLFGLLLEALRLLVDRLFLLFDPVFRVGDFSVPFIYLALVLRLELDEFLLRFQHALLLDVFRIRLGIRHDLPCFMLRFFYPAGRVLGKNEFSGKNARREGHQSGYEGYDEVRVHVCWVCSNTQYDNSGRLMRLGLGISL